MKIPFAEAGKLVVYGFWLSGLYGAIAEVESSRGSTSANVYQLRDVYIEDVNRIAGTTFTRADAENRDKAEYMMAIYWLHYGDLYQRETGKEPDFEVLARIHNGGPDGWRKESTRSYWQRVARVMSGGDL